MTGMIWRRSTSGRYVLQYRYCMGPQRSWGDAYWSRKEIEIFMAEARIENRALACIIEGPYKFSFDNYPKYPLGWSKR